jgi:hypothetical protein
MPCGSWGSCVGSFVAETESVNCISSSPDWPFGSACWARRSFHFGAARIGGNSATNDGGGLANYSYGGLNPTITLTNCTVSANQANGTTAQGGGIYALYSSVAAGNCTVVGNRANGTAMGEGGGIYGYGSVLNLVAANVKGNKATSASNDIFDGP